MSNKFTVSVECRGKHRDFDHTDIPYLENYLDSFERIGSYRDKYDYNSLISLVTAALKYRCTDLVEPVSEDQDITISIKYED